MDITQMQQTRQECVRRLLARRRPVTERIMKGVLGPDVKVREVVGSEFMPPASVSEWVDDMCAREPHAGPWSLVLFGIAEAARSGPDAAVAEMRKARSLSERDQWFLYASLRRWKDAAARVNDPGPAAVMRALVATWEDSSLAQLPPEPEELPDPPRPAKIKYRSKWGQPAGMAV